MYIPWKYVEKSTKNKKNIYEKFLEKVSLPVAWPTYFIDHVNIWWIAKLFEIFRRQSAFRYYYSSWIYLILVSNAESVLYSVLSITSSFLFNCPTSLLKCFSLTPNIHCTDSHKNLIQLAKDLLLSTIIPF